MPPRPSRPRCAGRCGSTPTNPRYFTDDSGRAILLTGAHTWNNLVDMGPSDPPPQFDFDAYLDWLSAYPHNFMRLWTWELTEWDVQTVRRARRVLYVAAPVGARWPGKALDGKPKFDLTQFDDEYFERLRDRVQAAGERGIYVSVMLFEGWGVQFAPNAWSRHPFNAAEQRQRHRRRRWTATARASRSTRPQPRRSPPSRRPTSARSSTRSTTWTTCSTRSPTRTTRRRPSGSTT